ncbi:hypothetical protein [Candidatus Nesciobacter abundans]|uniref:Uncharacterized protein n=1 Tax=Candidatus Nesciobacter abundans TaxID=2601668 RepID=A0A5C0UFV9_9PROT|nr:hypothetical protein [Candidatus Nesciobacter abundans]QEK38986.1 hypothetical protein FZC36_00860 [Candidatus Nesciobacter abundans]
MFILKNIIRISKFIFQTQIIFLFCFKIYSKEVIFNREYEGLSNGFLESMNAQADSYTKQNPESKERYDEFIETLRKSLIISDDNEKIVQLQCTARAFCRVKGNDLVLYLNTHRFIKENANDEIPEEEGSGMTFRSILLPISDARSKGYLGSYDGQVFITVHAFLDNMDKIKKSTVSYTGNNFNTPIIILEKDDSSSGDYKYFTIKNGLLDSLESFKDQEIEIDPFIFVADYSAKDFVTENLFRSDIIRQTIEKDGDYFDYNNAKIKLTNIDGF